VGANNSVQKFLENLGSTGLKTAASLADLIRRPELSYEAIELMDDGRQQLPVDVIEQVNISIKYQGYIERQNRQVEQFKKLEKRKIPADIDYEKINNLRMEARQKLSLIRPENIGQASRISGVSPADISVLLVYMKMMDKE
jgi:tRNA uridine 5-carboxymethylaminomethyl modification enzyme